MLTKKVCMLGAHGVGKRSLTSNFADQSSHEGHAGAVGVRICKKALAVDGREVWMMIWDITDWGRFGVVSGQLRGMNGFLLVADGTRAETIERVREIFEQIWAFEQPRAEGEESASYVQFPYRKIPFLLLLNKSDLTEEWKVEPSFLQILANKAWPVEVVSAKEDRGVEEAFLRLAREMLEQPAE